ncbi:MAG: D-glutamate cyclase family protein, partial [Rubrivivax sp.]
LIGVHDLSRPDYGDAVEVMPHELPVFWACGVTPQAALLQARPPLAITHAPGAMLMTDRLNHELAAF